MATRPPTTTPSAKPSPADTLVASQYHEMRWRILSLAADLDRIHRAEGGGAALASDPRLTELFACIKLLLTPTPTPNRAEQVQLLLSDPLNPPPPPPPPPTTNY